MTVDVRIDDRTLRELYLAPFEAIVRDEGAWAVMAAYNGVNGSPMTESPLLRDILHGEWGYDGLVMSDWTAAHATEAAALAALDLAMPGPASLYGPWGDALFDAVGKGAVDEALIDDKVVRILRLAARVGALAHSPDPPGLPQEGPTPTPPAVPSDAPDSVTVAQQLRDAAAAGFVLARNDGILPLPRYRSGGLPGSDRRLRVAVIGPNAEVARTMGGGSATVFPPYTISPLDGLRSRRPARDLRAGSDLPPACRGGPGPLAAAAGPVRRPRDRRRDPVPDRGRRASRIGTARWGHVHVAERVREGHRAGRPAGGPLRDPGHRRGRLPAGCLRPRPLPPARGRRRDPRRHLVAAGERGHRRGPDAAAAAAGPGPAGRGPVGRRGGRARRGLLAVRRAGHARAAQPGAAARHRRRGDRRGHRPGRRQRRGRGRGGDHRAGGKRGFRPPHAGPARPPGRAGPPGHRGQPPDRGGGELGCPGPAALGPGRGGGAAVLVRRPGVRRRARRRAARRRRARRAAALDVAGVRGRAAVDPAGGRRADLRRGPVHRLPRLRPRRPGTPVPVRSRHRLHHLVVRVHRRAR